MKKKLLATVLAGVLITSSLAGCGGNTKEDATQGDKNQNKEEQTLESGKVELTVWADPENVELMNQMIESFKQEYAGKAEFEITVAEQNESMTKGTLLADIHNGADVFTIPDDQLLSMVAAGALAPVANNEEVKNANLAESVEAATYNDVLYAYPYTADNGCFLYYNKNYFTDADVKTMDGILAAANAANKKVSMEFSSGWYLYSFFGNTGLDFGLNDDGVTNHCNWNKKDGTVTGIAIAQSLLDITSNPAFVEQVDADFITGAQSGEFVAGISGVWNAVKIKEIWGDDYGACKLPTYTLAEKQVQMASFTGYKMMGVNAYSNHVGWAQKLADWLTNEQNQTLRFEVKNQGPSNINAAASDAVKQVPAIQAVIAQGEFGTLQRVGNSYWDACVQFADIIAAGNPNGIELQELMDNLVNGITASTVK